MVFSFHCLVLPQLDMVKVNPKGVGFYHNLFVECHKRHVEPFFTTLMLLKLFLKWRLLESWKYRTLCRLCGLLFWRIPRSQLLDNLQWNWPNRWWSVLPSRKFPQGFSMVLQKSSISPQYDGSSCTCCEIVQTRLCRWNRGCSRPFQLSPLDQKILQTFVLLSWRRYHP